MIAQDTHESARPVTTESLTLPRVAATLQLLLATRRAARNAEQALRHSTTRGL
ncbi:MAG TPA: hypothetical protein VGL99_32800 [Chloroflexota bacterium]|jgi:hypothetical protein